MNQHSYLRIIMQSALDYGPLWNGNLNTIYDLTFYQRFVTLIDLIVNNLNYSHTIDFVVIFTEKLVLKLLLIFKAS